MRRKWDAHTSVNPHQHIVLGWITTTFEEVEEDMASLNIYVPGVYSGKSFHHSIRSEHMATADALA
jgi:hypothetical protein